MRGEWKLRDWEEEYWLHKMGSYIQTLFRGKNKINLTQEDINPYQVREILEELGWEQNDDTDTNGWEQDMWMRFSNPHYPYRLIVFSCGMTFQLEISLEDDV